MRATLVGTSAGTLLDVTGDDVSSGASLHTEAVKSAIERGLLRRDSLGEITRAGVYSTRYYNCTLQLQ
jgi:hypothetical protein